MAEKIVLIANDGRTFHIAVSIAKLSESIKNLIDDLPEGKGTPVPLPNVNGDTLEKMIEFCELYLAHPPVITQTGETSQKITNGKNSKAGGGEYKPSKETTDFCRALSDEHTFQLLIAADHLGCEPLSTMLCGILAESIKGKTPDEIRRKFSIVNDFTPEEEREVYAENGWLYKPIVS